MGPAEPKDDERIGRMLCGKWRIDAVLGRGGMATVFRATHRNGQRVAIKWLHQELIADERVRARFTREGYVANALEHPAVAAIYDDDEFEGAPFLVMELLEGQTLEALRIAEGGRLSPEIALPIFDELLDVLDVAHDREILHRDVKPENLFVLDDGHLKVLDFGLARLREGRVDGGLTRPDALIGTPAFMAPEQAMGRTDLIDPRSDIWGVGATMFHVLTGVTVHEGRTSQEQMANVATVPPRELRAAWPNAPEPLARLVDGALQFGKGARWATAAKMRAELRSAAAEMAVTLAPPASIRSVRVDPPESKPAPIAPPKAEIPPHRRWIIPVVAASALATSITATLIFTAPAKRPPAPIAVAASSIAPAPSAPASAPPTPSASSPPPAISAVTPIAAPPTHGRALPSATPSAPIAPRPPDDDPLDRRH